MSPEAYCRDLVARRRTEEELALLFAGPDAGAAAAPLFALEIELADSIEVDEQAAGPRLQWWRDELRRCWAGPPQHPVTRALQPVIERHRLSPEPFQQLVEGVAMDLHHAGFDETAELLWYCDRRRSVLYGLIAAVQGDGKPEAQTFAYHLGVAAALVDILRRTAADAARGRIYLPGEVLRRHGIGAEDLDEPSRSAAVAAAAAEIAELAAERFDKAYESLAPDARASQRTLLVLGALRHRTLTRLRRRGLRLPDPGAELRPLGRLYLAWRTARRALRRRPGPALP